MLHLSLISNTDMYSFDVSEESAKETYLQVCKAYEQILYKLELPIIKGLTFVILVNALGS